MIKWEYQLEAVKTSIAFNSICDIERYQGWELCGQEYGYFIFKRAIKEEPAEF